MKKILLTFFTFAFLLLPLNSQPSITWQRYYVGPLLMPENEGNDICKADSNNFYIVSWNTHPTKAYIIKINAYGDTIWAKLIDSLGAIAGASSGDGGCVFTGYNDAYPHYAYCTKINKNGTLEWKKIYENQNTLVSFSKITKTYDGGYVSCGYKTGYFGVIMKTDSQGNLTWQRTYSSSGDKFYWSIIEAYGGGYVAVGQITNNITSTVHGIVTRLDTDGNIYWEKEYAVNGIRIYDIRAIDKISNSYIFTGSMYDSTFDRSMVGYIRIDTLGNVLSNRILGDSTKRNYAREIKAIDTKKFIISTTILNFSGYTNNSIVYLIDTVGNILTSRLFSETTFITFARVLPLEKRDIMFVGNCNYFDTNFVNAFVARTDSNLYAPPISVKIQTHDCPSAYKIYPNFPNPFNGETTINFKIQKLSHIKMVIYDILGRENKLLLNVVLIPGVYSIKWKPENLNSGVYFCKFVVDNVYKEVIKIVFLK